MEWWQTFKRDMMSPLLLVATIGLAFALHRIIGALRLLRSVELEFYRLPRLPIKS